MLKQEFYFDGDFNNEKDSKGNQHLCAQKILEC